MKEYRLSPAAMVHTQGSSIGTQPKFFENGYWYKLDNVGYEGLSEYLVSKVLKHSNVQDFAEYERCSINGRSGCRSKHFLNEHESLLSFQRLYAMYTGGQLSEKIMTMNRVEERVDFVKDFIYDKTGVDCSEYLSKILTLDMLTLNTDRHFNNLGIIIDSQTNSCKPCTIFDNGRSLMSEWEVFDEETIEENIEKAYARPFSSNYGAQLQVCGIGLQIDYKGLEEELSHEPESRALTVLRYQLKRYRNIIPNLNQDIAQTSV